MEFSLAVSKWLSLTKPRALRHAEHLLDILELKESHFFQIPKQHKQTKTLQKSYTNEEIKRKREEKLVYDKEDGTSQT